MNKKLRIYLFKSSIRFFSLKIWGIKSQIKMDIEIFMIFCIQTFQILMTECGLWMIFVLLWDSLNYFEQLDWKHFFQLFLTVRPKTRKKTFHNLLVQGWCTDKRPKHKLGCTGPSSAQTRTGTEFNFILDLLLLAILISPLWKVRLKYLTLHRWEFQTSTYVKVRYLQKTCMKVYTFHLFMSIGWVHVLEPQTIFVS